MFYRREIKGKQVADYEIDAQLDARASSRILTSYETKLHNIQLKKKLDDLFEDDEEEQEGQEGQENDDELIEEQLDAEDDQEENPFMETEMHPSLKIVKEKNLYKYQPPSNNIVSPNKPIIQSNDLHVLKEYFDICISSYLKEASLSTLSEYENYMKEQKIFYYLKSMENVSWNLDKQIHHVLLQLGHKILMNEK